ncbi:MAG: hypothetical protein R2784_01420 [Saprospiraceae bacterium]
MNENIRKEFFEKDMPVLMDKLSADMEPQFGLMRPQHMVEHLVWVLKASNGKLDLPIKNKPERIPQFVAFLDTDIAIMPNYKNPLVDRDNTEPLEYSDLESAKAAFWKEWEDYKVFFKENPEAETSNTVYGYLGKDGWEKLHFKHILHHLVQFGLADSADYGLKPFEKK